MAQIIFSNGQSYILHKPMVTVGYEPGLDVTLTSPQSGLLFTIFEKPGRFELLSARHKLRVNGQLVHHSTVLNLCDRIEWEGGSAVFVKSDVAGAAPHHGTLGTPRSLDILQNLASTLQSSGGIRSALREALDALVEMAGAEVGYLLSEMGVKESWQLVASTHATAQAAQVSRQELFSNTILQEAIRSRDTVYVENIIGHHWASASSVIEAKIFSAVCSPLSVGDEVLGAIFLFTRSPGKSIRREALIELRLLATQVALMLGVQADLRQTRRENAQLKTLVHEREESLNFVGKVDVMRQLEHRIEKLAPTPLNVLILGETGVGKERVAQMLHQKSDRANGPFVAVNCAAIPSSLLESTLFGYERGAFTGAVKSQSGKFVLAEGGTLFLDEIGELSTDLQAKLLRVLQEKVVEPLGGVKRVELNVRVLAATHVDLEAAVNSGRFRQDLFFRLNGASLKIPPLRSRTDDILAMAEFFLQRQGRSFKFSEEAKSALQAHSWPGNVRELEHVVCRAAFLAEGPEIQVSDLELESGGKISPVEEMLGGEIQNLEAAQAEFTKAYIHQALAKFEGKRSETAEKLGVSERTLYRMIGKFTTPAP